MTEARKSVTGVIEVSLFSIFHKRLIQHERCVFSIIINLYIGILQTRMPSSISIFQEFIFDRYIEFQSC